MSDFRGITGSGKYQTRGGDVVDVLSHDGSQDRPWKCGDLLWRNDDGRSSGVDHDRELVAGPLSDEPEMAGLTGYSRAGEAFYFQRDEALESTATYGGAVIDLSKVPASAIVKPEPKRETRKVWLAWFKDLQVPMTYRDKPTYHLQSAGLIALQEVDMGFTHGEGLEG